MKRTVIITGGTKGLGRETALAFARNGCFVIALYAGDAASAREFEVMLREAGLAGVSLQHDVCSEDPAVWTHPFIQSADHLTLVHNAGATFSPTPWHQLTWADFSIQHGVAVKGAWECTRPLMRLMARHKSGTIITVLTDAMAGTAPKGFSAYLTAKHALHGFTLALAAEYAPRGLKIFSVSPGYMDTPLTRQWDHRLQTAIREQATRLTEPAAAARHIVALAESASTPGLGENHPI